MLDDDDGEGYGHGPHLQDIVHQGARFLVGMPAEVASRNSTASLIKARQIFHPPPVYHGKAHHRLEQPVREFRLEDFQQTAGSL